MSGFYEASEQLHPELQALSVSSQIKVRSTVLSTLRVARLLECEPVRSGQLGTVQTPSLSFQAVAFISDDPDLRGGFLLMLDQRRARP